ncbi:MAG: hypothetical protein HYV24_10580 [Deltaproteobacteria bacterium]|nr:hypothetical protein [Deltaproteobacteria bacterium]
MKVRQALFKYISPATPKELKLKLASREYTDEPLSPEDEVTILFVLGFDKDAEVSSSARKSFDEYPAHILIDALEKKLDPAVIKRIADTRKEDEAVQTMCFLNPCTDDETLKTIVETGPDEVVGVLAEERERFVEKPFLLDALKKNPLAPYLLVSSIEEMMKDARAKAVVEAEAGKRGLKDTEKLSVPKELVEDKKVDEQNIYKIVGSMSMGQKVKLALSGNKSAREVLIKDSNKMIAVAVLKNPRITEDEILRLTSSKGTPEDLLRQVARNKEWVKNYNVKLGIVTNPKTPLAISVKMLDYVYDKDLVKLAKSKNVPSVLASTARRKMDAKAKK